MTAIVIQQGVYGGTKYPLITVWAERIDGLIQIGNTGGIVVIGHMSISVAWDEYGRIFNIINEVETNLNRRQKIDDLAAINRSREAMERK